MTLRHSSGAAALALLLATACAPAAQTPEAPAAEAADTATFVAADFKVPTQVDTEDFKIVPLGPDLTEVDYEDM